MSNSGLALQFFVQLGIILTTCRLVGWVGKKYFAQPQAVGEMFAGVLLGPTVLGNFFPQLYQLLFPTQILISGVQVPHPSMQVLYVISQLGLVLYMFYVGLDFDLHKTYENRKFAFSVSLSGFIAPLLAGMIFGIIQSNNRLFFIEGASPLAIGLFVGSAMCITAFPLLARILEERKLTGSTIGIISLSAAAINDAIAWCLLSIVLAIAQTSSSDLLLTLSGTVLFAILMLTLGKHLLTLLEAWRIKRQEVTQTITAAVMLVLLASAYFTDYIGIHCAFGAFLAGICIPKGEISRTIAKNIETIGPVLLLPLYFTYSGLNTQVGLINSPVLFWLTLLICLIAVVSKVMPCYMAARLAKETKKTSLQIGILMNTRGLIELIILNIGLEAGLITPTFFSMMVIMAIATTAMTGPLFNLVQKKLT